MKIPVSHMQAQESLLRDMIQYNIAYDIYIRHRKVFMRHANPLKTIV